jgi:hypothetical protein
MFFRDPIYLDIHLLTNLAEFRGFTGLSATDVREKSAKGRTVAAGIDKYASAIYKANKQQETEESYSKGFKPVRVFNELVENLQASGDFTDLTVDFDAALSSHAVLQIEGELALSGATEIGTWMARLWPVILNKAAQGQVDPDFEVSDLAGMLSEQSQAKHVYDLEVSAGPDRNYVVIAEPANVPSDRSIDDIEGTLTVFGVVERLIPEGRSFSLSQYVFPDMPRVFRRSIRGKSEQEMLDAFSGVAGSKLDASTLRVEGPGAIIKPVAIY